MHSFTVSALIPATKESIYNAWLDSNEHAAMTGTKSANASNKNGDTFMAHDGYISGKNIELTPSSKIIQHWRTKEFTASDPDSLIVVTLDDADGGTLLTLTHSQLPEHGMQYKSGWVTHYFEPMKRYFEEN